jgi:hypothetical protein
MRLIWSNTAFLDEAEYLLAGHLELAHLTQHTAFSTYFSGAPVIYPPIAAYFDGLGGLAAARLLSLAFMLLATTLLHGVARRLLSDRVAATLAAALFAWLGPTQFLGAFATYDAMALGLLAAATWLGVLAAEKSGWVSYALLVGASFTMALADATKYASALFNPVVIAVIGLAVWRKRGRADGPAAAVLVTTITTCFVVAAYQIGGGNYALGIDSTTLNRPPGVSPIGDVASITAHGIALTAVLAVVGALIMSRKRSDGPTLALMWVLVFAIFLAPINQARLHTTVSLFKHLAFGGWFGSVAAGYALAAVGTYLAQRVPARQNEQPALQVPLATCALIAVCGGVLGLAIADNSYGAWQNSSAMVAALKRLNHSGASFLTEDYTVPSYYLWKIVPSSQIWSPNYFGYWDRPERKFLTGDPAYAYGIEHRYFTAIVMSFSDSAARDSVFLKDIRVYRTYQLAQVIHYRTSSGSGEYQIWTPTPAS